MLSLNNTEHGGPILQLETKVNTLTTNHLASI
jgi:hypothetical protein